LSVATSIRAAAVLAVLFVLSGCVTDGAPSRSASAATPDSSCSNLTDERRKLAVQIDAVESGRSAPGTFTSAILMIGMLNSPQMGMMTGAMAQDRANALVEMRNKQTALTQQIEQRQCTAAARAKAGAIKPVEDARQNGVYAGRGQTESWCAAPAAALELSAGHVSGTVTSGDKNKELYDVSGQLYDDGTLSLEFMRPKSRRYTDEFDGTLRDGVLSFTAKLDLSPQGCIYRFAVKPAAVAASSAATVGGAGAWTAHIELIEEKSLSSCSRVRSRYSLDLSGDTFTVDNSNGRMFVATVPADGRIDRSFHSPSGADLTIVGNARSRELEIMNSRSGCRWKLASN
jgi:hypothetical protein